MSLQTIFQIAAALKYGLKYGCGGTNGLMFWCPGVMLWYTGTGTFTYLHGTKVGADADSRVCKGIAFG